jgi:HTH-type transcriptional regulator/antitoxin HigA
MKTSNNIKYIHSEKDYADAIALIDTLWNAKEDTPEYNEFEILIELLDAYERKLQFLESANPVEAIKFHMWQRDLNETDLGEVLGSLEIAEKILSKKIKLTLTMIWKLSEQWKIPAESLVKPYITVPKK